jgi:hypothetical protein
MRTTGGSTNLLVTATSRPSTTPKSARRCAGVDRKAFIDIISQGEGHMGVAMLSRRRPWGCRRKYATCSGYDPDVQKNRAEAQHHAEVRLWARQEARRQVSTRNVIYRDSAVILIDQLEGIYAEGVLDTIETANWHSSHPQGLHGRTQ